jgi:hypothetical protein
VRVTLTYRSGKATRRKTLNLTVRNGKFSGSVRLPAGDARKASRPAVSAGYAGDGGHLAATARGRITIRR